MQSIIGWDVGGAHLKAACLSVSSESICVYQVACPLWQGLQTLEQAITEIQAQLPAEIIQHAVTMTGELVDLFANKAEGVAAIIETLEQCLSGVEIKIYAGKSGFIDSDKVTASDTEAIASANWHASAAYAAQFCQQGVFVDIGSTTTDILLIEHQQLNALGYTDFQRLQSSELIYTGLVRTAVMAVAQTVEFLGTEIGVMSEYFATMADVYRLTVELKPEHDQTETADGAEKNMMDSARRLARMVGCDVEDFSLSDWQSLAISFRKQQLKRIEAGCQRQLSRLKKQDQIVLIGAGVGRFLVKDIAQNLGCDYQDFGTFFPSGLEESRQIADCAPAVAVASLVHH